jgi:toxin YhaV
VLERHGWRLFGHPLFFDQLDRLHAAVARARRIDPAGWRGNSDARLLAAICTLVMDRIPRDPLAPEFRQGNTLGRLHRLGFVPSSPATGFGCSSGRTRRCA